MLNKIVKLLALFMVLGVTGAQAVPDLSDSNSEPSILLADLAKPYHVTVGHGSGPAAMADCCQPHGEQAGCQHCTDNGCDNGSCGSCSHCVTALMHSPFASSDSHPAYRQIPANYFLTVYQATDPRPPQA